MQKRGWRLEVGRTLNSGMGGQKGRVGHQGAKDGLGGQNTVEGPEAVGACRRIGDQEGLGFQGE